MGLAMDQLSTRTTQLPTTPDGKHGLVEQVELEVLDGPDQGRKLQSNSERIAIGTHEANDLVLKDTAISRFHCQIDVVEGRAIIRDIGSLNGTFVDGVTVFKALLKDKSIVKVGRTRIQFRMSSGQVLIPLSERKRFGVLVGQSPAMRSLF